MRWLFSALFYLMVFTVEGAYVVTNTGRQINGSDISADDDGAVTLTTDAGQVMTFRRGQYRSAVADRPAELGEARECLERGDDENAVLLLKKVKRDCRNLQWDQMAIRVLADHFFAVGQYDAALQEYELLNDQDREVQQNIRDAMMRSGDTESILVVLNRDIASGSRERVADAYLLRGELKMKSGDTEGARRDWLKVRLYFNAQKDQVRQAEERLDGME